LGISPKSRRCWTKPDCGSISRFADGRRRSRRPQDSDNWAQLPP
jgi:hypothetical protein